MQYCLKGNQNMLAGQNAQKTKSAKKFNHTTEKIFLPTGVTHARMHTHTHTHTNSSTNEQEASQPQAQASITTSTSSSTTTTSSTPTPLLAAPQTPVAQTSSEPTGEGTESTDDREREEEHQEGFSEEASSTLGTLELTS